MKLMPASSARWTILMHSSSSVLPHSPNIIAPRQCALTLTPVRPSVRYCMIASPFPKRRLIMPQARRRELRHHMTAWLNLQFLHGEQGALICASKIVQTVPDVDSKFYAATQVMDEARHVEMYSKYLREKIELAYPINKSLQALLADIIADTRWAMTY